MNRLVLSSAFAMLLGAVAAPAGAYELGRNPNIFPTTCAQRPGFNDALSLRAFGLTSDQRLVCFRDRAPQQAASVAAITGLTTDTSIVGIDYRVQDGLLYGVGNLGGVYVISTTTGVATLVNRLSVTQVGTAFGVDFNPAADRLRIISNTGQNLRHNVNSGGTTIDDTGLAYTAGTPATTVTGAAYTNNDLDANTATTLFDLDTTMDQVVLQSPANAGTLAATGKLLVDAQAAVGMDIYSTVRSGATIDNEALAVITPAGGSANLYNVELTTGKAILRGTFPTTLPVVDIAIPLGQR